MDYHSQVIGLNITYKSIQGFIPCLPSAVLLDTNIPIQWVDDIVPLSYTNTLTFLKTLSEEFSGKIPCKPAIKIIEDGLIVGILTITNSFVPIYPPEQDMYGNDLPIRNSTNYFEANKKSILSNKKDVARETYIHKIKLENGFFKIFRNTVRSLLGTIENRSTRVRLEDIIKDYKEPYISKLKTVDAIIRDLVKDYVIFSEYSPEVLSSIKSASVCFNNVDCQNSKQCLYDSITSKCKVIIPKTNLINMLDNSNTYFGRIADEIIRYKRIQSFIFEPNTFLSIGSVKYNLHKNEIIVLQSILLNNYFDNLIPEVKNKYITQNTYDTAIPGKSQNYSDKVNYDIDAIKDEICPTPTYGSIQGKWKPMFPRNSQELIFSNKSSACTFEMMLIIIKHYNPQNKDVTVEMLRGILADKYSELYTNNFNVVINMYKAQGKTTAANNIKQSKISIDDLIMSEDYYISNIDIWILSNHYRIPCLLYSSTTFIETNSSILITYTSDDINSFYFIKAPAIKQNSIPSYRLVITNDKIPFIREQQLSSSFQNLIETSKGKISLEDYIRKSSVAKIKIKKQKSTKLNTRTKLSTK